MRLLTNGSSVVSDRENLADFTDAPASPAAEHTYFAIGAAYAVAFGLLFWAAIGVGVYKLISP